MYSMQTSGIWHTKSKMMVQPSTMKLLRMAVVIRKRASNSFICRTSRNMRKSRNSRPRRRIWPRHGLKKSSVFFWPFNSFEIPKHPESL